MLSIKDCNPEMFRANELAYIEYLKDYKNWHNIPLLNHTPLHLLKDLTLVRFRGMIQDMFNPEIYLDRYEVHKKSSAATTTQTNISDGGNYLSRIQDGKYRDLLVLNSTESVDYESKSNVYGERRTLFVISIPGINKWASDIEHNYCENTQKIQQQNFGETQHPLSSSASLLDDGGSGQKRQINEDNAMHIDSSTTLSTEFFTNNFIVDGAHKKVKTESTTNKFSNLILSHDYLLNSPIQDRPSKACMVKVYSDFDDFRLNTIIEAVGFLSVDPSLDGSTLNDEETNDDFMMSSDVKVAQATNPPPSLIPRLHAISIRNLEHTNPLCYHNNDYENSAELNPNVIYGDLRIILRHCLFGDEIAADYLLLHLISRVYVRMNLETLGQMTLNISNIPDTVLPEYTKHFYEILEMLLPASHYFPMTLDNMNTIQFVPKKDYTTDRLTSGLLQLAPHTHLILDETQLQTGKLQSNGITGVQHLSHLIQTQQIKCDFEYYDVEVNVNIAVLIFSEGKSMLPSNFHIPLHITDTENIQLIDETLKAAKHYLRTKLHDYRKYLTLCKIQTEFNMSPLDDDIQKTIENDFVQMRSMKNSQIGTDELHSLLVLSRLVGIAKGKTKLDQESWDVAKQMEEIRRFRIEQNKIRT